MSLNLQSYGFLYIILYYAVQGSQHYLYLYNIFSLHFQRQHVVFQLVLQCKPRLKVKVLQCKYKIWIRKIHGILHQVSLNGPPAWITLYGFMHYCCIQRLYGNLKAFWVIREYTEFLWQLKATPCG